MLDDHQSVAPEAIDSLPDGPPQLASPPPPATPPVPLAPREIWGLRDLLLLVAFIPFALYGSKIILLLGYSAFRPLAGWQATADEAQSGTIFLLIEQCVFYFLILTFLVLLARLIHQQPFWKSLGWKRLPPKAVLGGIAGGFGLAMVASFGLWLLPDQQSFPLEKLFDSRLASIAIGAFAILIAPVVEELVFRGLLFAIVERLVGVKTAVVATAFLFASLHAPEYWHAWNHLIMIALVGLVFSLVRAFTGNLAASTIMHVGYNSLIMMGVFFSTKHFHSFSAILR
jgi:membrane protease YdiL (CAAX protease family)